MSKQLTLDEVAQAFPEYCIEVTRSSPTGDPPSKWYAVWYQKSGYHPQPASGDTQEEALRALLRHTGGCA